MTTTERVPLSDDHRFELLVGAISDYAIYMLDTDGFITSWNSGAERIKGYSRSEILGQHFSRFFTTEDRANKVPAFILASAQRGGRHEAEGWRVRKDGQRFWANAILQAVREPDGSLIGFAKITRDMTDKMEARRAIEESERRFRMLVDGVIDYAIYMLDPSGVVVNWNSGAQRLKGYTSDEIIGQHFSRFYTKEDRARGLPGLVLATATDEGRFEGEGWRLRKDGSRFWASVVVDAIHGDDGRIIGYAKVTRDITERRAAHEALKESERQFRLLVNNVTDYAIYMLDPNGVITSWNAGAARIKGYQAQDVIGHHFSRFYTEQDRAAGLPARALYKAQSEGRFEAEAWRVRKDGSLFWANVVIDPIRDEHGDLIGFAKITRDITERRNAETERKKIEAERAHAQKMDALGQLTGGVAHDFNNLLMVISGHLPKLKKFVEGHERLDRAVAAMEIATQRGAALTRQLLSFSRRQPSDPKIVDVSHQLKALAPILSSLTGTSIKLVTLAPDGLWPIKVDVNELELAVVNLVVNSRDAMPHGGTLTVSAENVTLTPEDAAVIVGDAVALRVSDTGVGIPPDVIPKVFEPFFTTKDVNRGTGLGLAQVHGFAHQSHGTAAIASELGLGTTITLYFPKAADNAAPEPRKECETSGGYEKILIVEDNPSVAEVTVAMVQDLGYRTVVARNGEEAISCLKAEPFDLVLTDIVMPGQIDGTKLAAHVREHYAATPVLLVTGYSESAAQLVGDIPVMRKPFEISELGRTLARLLALSRLSDPDNVIRLRK